MLREEQIDIRRQRAVEGKFTIKNLGRNRVFSDYQVINPATGGQYQVSIRGFEVGDNTCTCPDYRTNTLGTCKHIEAVLATLRDQTPPPLRRRKAAVVRPEVYLRYGEQLVVGIHLPARHSPNRKAALRLSLAMPATRICRGSRILLVTRPLWRRRCGAWGSMLCW